MSFGDIIYALDDVLWGKPFLFFVFFISIYFTLRSGLFQIVHFPHVMKNTLGALTSKEAKNKKEGTVSPFEAVCIAIGGCVGCGNMAGVASAIAVGGPGSLFWIWVAAFLGMMTKCVEISLAVYYRSKDEHGGYYSSTPTMVEKGLVRRRGIKAAMVVAVLFAIGFVAQFLGGSQAYTISEILHVSFGLPMMLVTVLYTAVLYYIIFGGTPRVAKVATTLVPFMCVLFIVGGLGIIIANLDNVIPSIVEIFKYAFTPHAAVGAFTGTVVSKTISKGMARSINSNEAGQGSSPLIHGSANTVHPVRQGLWGSFEVFVDTIIVCSITGLAVIISGCWSNGMTGATLTIESYRSVYGSIAPLFIGLMACLFGITTTAGWFTYYIAIIRWAFARKPKTRDMLCKLFKFVFPIPNLIIVGSITLGGYSADLFWAIVDVTLIIPVFSNLLAMFLLRNDFFALLKDYKARFMGKGTVDPNFHVFYEDDPKIFAEEEALRAELRKIDEQA